MSDFNAEERAGRIFAYPLKSGETIAKGEMCFLNEEGKAVALIAESTTLKTVGRIDAVDETYATARRGCFAYLNSATDALTVADINADCYAESATTVCKTATKKSKAGKVLAIEDGLVWVEF